MKNIITHAIILATVLFLFSCNLNKEKTNSPINTPTVDNKQQSIGDITQETETSSTTLNLSLDDFKGIPEEIDGCSCYFSETDQKFENQEYLFVANFDSTGFVSVDKKLVKLKLISTEREPNTFGEDDHIDIYNSEHYNVTVDIKYKKSSGDETWWNDGTVTIESKDGQKLTKNFVGECGC